MQAVISRLLAPKNLVLHESLNSFSALRCVFCRAFAAFGGNEHFLVSGGNDKFIKLWNWRSSLMVSQSDNGSALVINLRHGKKVCLVHHFSNLAVP